MHVLYLTIALLFFFQDSKKKKPMSAMEEIMLEESKRKEEKEKERLEKEKRKKNHDVDDDDDDDADDRPWLQKGIVVKLTTKRLGDKFHKKKAIVKEVLDDKFTALIKLIDSGEKVSLVDDVLHFFFCVMLRIDVLSVGYVVRI